MAATAYGSADKLPLSGGTLTGPLVLAGSPPLGVTGGTLGKILASDGAGNFTLQAPGYSGGIDWLDARLYGAKGDGVTDDAAAINAALSAAKPGQTVYLPATSSGVQTTYAVGSPIFRPPYVTLRGPLPMRSGNSVGGAIKALSTFTAAGIVQMVDQATGGYASAHENGRLIDLTIDGSAIPGTQTTAGVLATGYVHGELLENVSVSAVPGKAFNSLSNGSGQAYSWVLRNCQALNCGSDGYRFSNLTDSVFEHCRAIGNGRHGFYIGSLFNTTFTGCHAEWSTQNNWNITEAWGSSGSGGDAWFLGCSSDRAGHSGFYIDATGHSQLVFASPVCRRDGRNGGAGGGGYAGFYINGATTPVIITGIATSPGVDDNGTGTQSPDYGLRAGGATYVSVQNGHVWGAVAGWHDDGTNTTLRRGPSVLESTGTITTPTLNLNNPWGWDNSQASGAMSSDATALALSSSATNTTNPLLNYTSGGATGLADASKASGDAATRFQRDVSGLMKFGDGTNAKDTTWYRMGAGTIGTDNSLDVALHALGLVTPREHGLIAWSCDPRTAAGSSSDTLMSSGVWYLTGLYVSRSATATKIYWGTQVAAAGQSAGQNFLALFDSTGAVKASLGIDAALTGTTGAQTSTISSTALTPGFYWAGIVQNATTPAKLWRSSNSLNVGTLLNWGISAAASRPCASNGTGITAVGAITPSSNASANPAYCYAFALGP